MNVTIYTTPTCGFCKQTKSFFKDNNVEYTEIDVAENQDKAKELVEKSGQMGVPVTIVEKDGKEDVENFWGYNLPLFIHNYVIVWRCLHH